MGCGNSSVLDDTKPFEDTSKPFKPDNAMGPGPSKTAEGNNVSWLHGSF